MYIAHIENPAAYVKSLARYLKPTARIVIVDYLAKIPGVASIKSSFALKQVKYKTALPLPQPERQSRKR